jgi:hypothetical protein
MTWKAFLEETHYSENFVAQILAKVLGQIPDPKWFDDAVAALTANARKRGKVWKKWVETKHLDPNDIVAAIKAHQRHTKTNYEELLCHGVERNTALRICTKREE